MTYRFNSIEIRVSALEKQRDEYSSVKNQAAFVELIIAKINQQKS